MNARRLLTVTAGLGLLSPAAAASEPAGPFEGGAGSGGAALGVMRLSLLPSLMPLAPPPAALVDAGYAPAATASRRAQGGVLFGLDAGGAWLLPNRIDSARGALAFGVRAGYQFPIGIAIQARYDDLGVEPLSAPGSRSVVQVGSLGVRYTVPALIPLPFVEAMAGPAFFGGETAVAAGFGLGVSLPVSRHFSVDLSGRDWLTRLDGVLRQVVTVQLGFDITFGSRGH